MGYGEKKAPANAEADLPSLLQQDLSLYKKNTIDCHPPFLELHHCQRTVVQNDPTSDCLPASKLYLRCLKVQKNMRTSIRRACAESATHGVVSPQIINAYNSCMLSASKNSNVASAESACLAASRAFLECANKEASKQEQL